ncbi:MAG: hypothetical protein LUC26_04485 [Prevotella sp.]|nr:hypothetical protein [Prevotella sp.]
MKRFLLIMLAAVMSTAMFAQVKVSKEGMKTANFAKMVKAQAPVLNKAETVNKGIARSQETGLYYTKPEGSMYETTYKGMNSYIQTFVVVPAWEENYAYTNMSTVASTWQLYNSSTYEFEDDTTGMTDFEFSYLYPGYGYYTPMLRDQAKTDYYTMDPYYFDAEYGGYEGMLFASYDIDQMGFFNNKEWTVFGSMDNGNLTGSGTVTYEGVTYTCESVGQLFPAPASPLYVESIDVMGNINGSVGAKDSAMVTMKIYNTDTGKLMETLTAGEGDFSEGATVQLTGSSTSTTCCFLNFTKKVTDEIFGEMTEPITIDYPSTIIIEGFDNSNIDFGVAGFQKYECDDMSYLPENEYGDIFLDCISSDGEEIELRYEGLAMSPVFNGMMDKIMAEDELYWDDYTSFTGYSILQMSDDGKTCDTYGMEDSDYNLGAVYVETVRDWEDEDGNENYSYITTQNTDEDNDWITGYNVYDYSEYGYYLIEFQTEALPSDMEGRSAVLYFTGAGYTDSQPVIIIQGNAEVPSGINSVLAYPEQAAKTKYAGTYNLAGQRVSDSTKGLVVKDGKKVLVK